MDSGELRAKPERDAEFMAAALDLARAAAAVGEVPVGAVAVCRDQIIGRGANARQRDQDPVAHAEIGALREAAKALGVWHLVGVTLYVTLEPCAMCAGALVNARVDRLVFGARDPKAGAAGSLYNIVQDARLNHRLEVTSGILAEECAALLSAFFQSRREER